MNVVIVDFNKISLKMVEALYDKAVETTGDDWIFLPKDMDLLQDVHVDWLKMIRDKLNEKINELER